MLGRHYTVLLLSEVLEVGQHRVQGRPRELTIVGSGLADGEHHVEFGGDAGQAAGGRLPDDLGEGIPAIPGEIDTLFPGRMPIAAAAISQRR